MPKVLIDARNTPTTININELLSGMQTLNNLDIKMMTDSKDFPQIHNVKISQDSNLNNHLEDIDIFITLNPQISTNDLNLISKKGIVPLLHKNFSSVGFTAFRPVEEEGNSFLFEDWNQWAVFAALVRSLENYAFPYDWSNIVHSVKNIEIEI